MVKIWSEVLGVSASRPLLEPEEYSKIGIDDNFFQLGGHSLKATIMISKIHKELQVKVPLAEVFRNQTIRGLSKYIKDARRSKYADIEPVEKREYYALSSAQQRIYFLQQMAPDSTTYNMPMVLPLGKDIEKNKLESTLKQLITRHESLRTSFERVNEEPVQMIHDKAEFEIEYFEATDLHRQTQRGWHPQPTIAAGIRKCRRKNFGMKTRFRKIVIHVFFETTLEKETAFGGNIE